MKVGRVQYTAAELDCVDLDFPVGRPGSLVSSEEKAGRKGDQHVARGNNGWIVFGEGNSKATAIRPTQTAAIKIAARIAGRKKASVIVHQAGGGIVGKTVARRGRRFASSH